MLHTTLGWSRGTKELKYRVLSESQRFLGNPGNSNVSSLLLQICNASTQTHNNMSQTFTEKGGFCQI